MRDFPRPLFCTQATKGQKEVFLAIGSVEESGQISAYFAEDEGRHSQLVYLFSGSDSYHLWRAYMQELSRLEKEDWQFQRRDLPRPSEVDKGLRV